MRILKMIWEFRGPESYQTAKHHAIHLEEFAKKHNLEKKEAGVDKESDLYSIAYLICHEKDMILVRDTLKPHKAFLHQES